MNSLIDRSHRWIADCLQCDR
uniref:Uncharacterized protein n=1 Tax=Arundo donax TaxID=35708 RepID=A0A0A9HPG4_ARUDO